MKKIMIMVAILAIVVGFRKWQENAASNVVAVEVTTQVEASMMPRVVQEKTQSILIRDKGASFKMQSSSKNSPAPVAPENPHLNK